MCHFKIKGFTQHAASEEPLSVHLMSQALTFIYSHVVTTLSRHEGLPPWEKTCIKNDKSCDISDKPASRYIRVTINIHVSLWLTDGAQK